MQKLNIKNSIRIKILLILFVFLASIIFFIPQKTHAVAFQCGEDMGFLPCDQMTNSSMDNALYYGGVENGEEFYWWKVTYNSYYNGWTDMNIYRYIAPEFYKAKIYSFAFASGWGWGALNDAAVLGAPTPTGYGEGGTLSFMRSADWDARGGIFPSPGDKSYYAGNVSNGHGMSNMFVYNVCGGGLHWTADYIIPSQLSLGSNSDLCTKESLGTPKAGAIIDRDITWKLIPGKVNKFYMFLNRKGLPNRDGVYIKLYKKPSQFNITSVTATPICSGRNEQVKVSWSASGAKSYKVWRLGPSPDHTWRLKYSGTGTSFIDTDIKEKSSYIYVVRAYSDANGSGSYSEKYSNDGKWLKTPDCRAGVHSTLTCDYTSGWAVDPWSTSPPKLGFYLDSSSSYFGEYQAHSDFGFKFNFSDEQKAKLTNGKSHKLYAYVKPITGTADPNGYNRLLQNSPKTIVCSAPKAEFNVLMVANSIEIKRNNVTINYDSNAVNNPPPGFKELLTPIWEETAP